MKLSREERKAMRKLKDAREDLFDAAREHGSKPADRRTLEALSNVAVSYWQAWSHRVSFFKDEDDDEEDED